MAAITRGNEIRERMADASHTVSALHGAFETRQDSRHRCRFKAFKVIVEIDNTANSKLRGESDSKNCVIGIRTGPYYIGPNNFAISSARASKRFKCGTDRSLG